MRRLAPPLALVLVALGCGPLDVRLGYLPDAGPDAGRPPRPCTTNADCQNVNFFCERSRCDAPVGTCQQKPTFDCRSTGPELVCGCDDVTYFNSCYRRNAGTSPREPHECGNPLPCGADGGCPAEAVCARLTTACGAVEPEGTCWVVPPTCPGTGTFQECGNPSVCLDPCQAIRGGRPAVAVATGTCP